MIDLISQSVDQGLLAFVILFATATAAAIVSLRLQEPLPRFGRPAERDTTPPQSD